MANNDIGFLPIIENEKLIGVISETDIVKIIGDNEDLNAQVYKYANKKLIVIHKDKTLKEAVELMINNNIRHLPIIDDNEKVMGVISVKDLIKILA
ncbi:MAG: CBS domain-containing protein [Candidatus Methanomethylicaceae archaeon]